MMDLEGQLTLWIKEGENAKVEETLVNLHVHHVFDKSKTMLLHCAAKYDNRIITQLLLDNGCDVNAQDSAGLTPLMVAVKGKHEEVIKILLLAGADVLILNNENKSALEMFCADDEFSAATGYVFFREVQKKCSSTEEIAEILIRARCRLYQAVYLNDMWVVNCMFKRNAFPAQHLCKKDGDLALQRAIYKGSAIHVKQLLQIGANVNFKDIYGQTALMTLQNPNFEATSERAEILKILLNHGVSPISHADDGTFDIQPTLTNGSREMIRVLLECNLDFTFKDKIYGRSVLHYLAKNLNSGVVEEITLHHKTLDVNILDNDGISPLCWAANSANANMVAFLLSQGAEVNVADHNFGFTPLLHAHSGPIPGRENQYEQCIQLLLEHDADFQFTLTGTDGKEYTIFDLQRISTHLNRMKPIIAHLAVLEGQGKLISDITYARIRSYPLLRRYLNRCRRLLKRKISGSATFLKLLTVNRKKSAQYLKNEEITFKLKRLSYKQKLSASYSFYRNKLEKWYLEGIYYNNLKDKAAESICTIFGNIIHKENLIIHKIIDYLDNESLGSLYRLFTIEILDLSIKGRSRELL